MSASDGHLADLNEHLEAIATLVARGEQVYRTDLACRMAVQRLWIAVGECARRYCDASGADLGEEPWSSLWGYRNVLAHRLPAEISDERVWAETTQDLAECRGVLEQLRASET